MTLTQDLFDRITRALNQGATNYTVFLRQYQLSMDGAGNDLTACVRKAVDSDAEVGGAEQIEVAVLLSEMNDLLSFAGDPGAGPDASVLESKEFLNMLVELRECTSELAGQANRVERFWLKKGHPSYPVFWDFAYFLSNAEIATILIGSSSD